MAIATATVTFTLASGLDSQAFVWTPTLTSSPPKYLGAGTIVSGGEGPVNVFLNGNPTNVGGTLNISAPTDCVITLVASD